MAPPYKRNPVATARSEFLGEPAPSYYFPRPGSEGAFRPYYSPSHINAADMETEDFLTRQSDFLTRRRQNAFTAKDLASKERVMPFREREEIAKSRYGIRKTRAEMGLIEPEAEYQKERMEAGTEAVRAEREDLPEQRQYEQQRRQADMERMLSDDPVEGELSKISDDPGDIINYRSFFNRTDPKMPKSERQRAAFGRAMRIVKDRKDILALQDALADGRLDPETYNSLIDPDMDEEGNYYGDIIKPDKDARRTVARLVAEGRILKDQERRASEERQAERLARDSNIRALTKLLEETKDEIDNAPTGSQALLDAQQRRAEYKAELDRLYRSGMTSQETPGAKQPAAGGRTPAKTDSSSIDALFGPK